MERSQTFCLSREGRQTLQTGAHIESRAGPSSPDAAGEARQRANASRISAMAWA